MDGVPDLQGLLARQQEAVRRHGAPGLKARLAALDGLSRLVRRHQGDLIDAVSADFGNRARQETELGELMPLLNGIRHVRRHLKGWMRPERRSAGLAFQPASARVEYQPLGVVGILSPWNYPLFLTLGPLVDALAAGNRVMIKPSELAARTGHLLHTLLATLFPQDQVTVVTGGAEVAAEFSRLPFDHLVFTGSTRVGRAVMQAAAGNLTPVTLELGGKSPVLILPDYPLDKAARTIAMGKFFNAGQTCVAPDYVLVPRDRMDTFARTLMRRVEEMYPAIAGNPDYTSIITDRHHARLSALVADAGGQVLRHRDPGDPARRLFPPTLLIDPPTDRAVMREEIFGPVLPILPYDRVEDALSFINERPKPLALYCYSDDARLVAEVLDGTRSGGVTVNATMLHVGQEDLPFGGVGESGTGAYHGREGFRRLSHARAVLRMGRFNQSHLVAAPYGKLTGWITRLFIGGAS
ncbi:coniferyl aldehyde dehydrogenase [Niveispirillum sp.]|uniref:coniferyl aldehyde dehydrogenase n=1 Tax=Niveispirillum sp. TaxID=1917217 RepID=UPI001B49495F|nr:coniferyl aldehyde dehydrogenase [Niveispirillum sp.]MBP7338483.1 coniferyl aldehyde dehydrogenase [Niveispirillum sp.]